MRARVVFARIRPSCSSPTHRESRVTPEALSPRGPPLSPANTPPPSREPHTREQEQPHPYTCNTTSRTYHRLGLTSPADGEVFPADSDPWEQWPPVPRARPRSWTRADRPRGRCSLHLVPTDRTDGQSQRVEFFFRCARERELATRANKRANTKSLFSFLLRDQL